MDEFIYSKKPQEKMVRLSEILKFIRRNLSSPWHIKMEIHMVKQIVKLLAKSGFALCEQSPPNHPMTTCPQGSLWASFGKHSSIGSLRTPMWSRVHTELGLRLFELNFQNWAIKVVCANLSYSKTKYTIKSQE